MDQLLEKTIRQHVDEPAKIISTNEFTGVQGYSGAEVRYFDVVYKTAVNETKEIKLVVKNTPLVGRKVLQLLDEQLDRVVPFNTTDDVTIDSAEPICQQFIPESCTQLNNSQPEINSISSTLTTHATAHSIWICPMLLMRTPFGLIKRR